MDNLKSQGMKSFAWHFLGKIISHGMGLVVAIFLARLLDPSDFGLMAIVMVIIGMATIFADIGLSGALIQRRKTLPIHYSSVFYFNIFIGMFLTFVTYYSAPWISMFYQDELLIPLTQVLSLSFIISAFSNVQTTRLRKELNYALITKIEIFSSLLSGAVGISLAFMGAGIWSLVAQTLTRAILYNILIWTQYNWVPGFMFSWRALTQLWGYGFRMFLVGLLEAIYSRMDYLIIGKLFDATILGFFHRAKSLNMMAVTFSSESLKSVIFPVLSKVQKDLVRFQHILIKSLGIITFAAFLIFGCLYVAAEEIIVILFSDKWLPSVEYFKLLALSGFFYPINILLVNVLSSRGNSKAFLRMAIYKKIIGFMNLGVGFLYGIKGYLYGLIVVAVIHTYITIVMASRESRTLAFNLYKPIIVQVMIVAISILTTLYFVDHIQASNVFSLVIKATIFLSLFVILNWMFKTSSFTYLLEELIPIIRQVSTKVKLVKGA